MFLFLNWVNVADERLHLKTRAQFTDIYYIYMTGMCVCVCVQSTHIGTIQMLNHIQ